MDLVIEPDEVIEKRCACCQRPMKMALGYAYEDDEPRLMYIAHFTPSHPDMRVHLEFGLGEWGEDKRAEDRLYVSMQVWLDGANLVTGYVDAGGQDHLGRPQTAAAMRKRKDSAGFFEISDAILRTDTHVASFILRAIELAAKN